MIQFTYNSSDSKFNIPLYFHYNKREEKEKHEFHYIHPHELNNYSLFGNRYPNLFYSWGGYS